MTSLSWPFRPPPAGRRVPERTPPSGNTANGRRERSIRRSLNVLTVVLVVLAAAMIGLSSVAFVRLTDAREALLGQVDPASLDANQLLLAYVDEETGVRGYLLSRNSTFLQPAISGYKNQLESAKLLHQDLRNIPQLWAQAKRAELAAQHWQNAWAEPAIKATASGNLSFTSPEAQAYGKELLDKARSDFTTLNHELALSRAQDGAALQNATTSLAITAFVGVGLPLVLAVALRLYVRRWVTRPLGSVASDARSVTEGDLSHPISAPEPKEIRELGLDIEEMRQRIVFELSEVSAARMELDEMNTALRRSNSELEQFAYVASHDLQEPLRKVTSFVQLLQERYEGQLDERADQYIAFAVDGARRMQQLISDLLSFSRVGRTTDRFEVVEMAECIALALDNLQAPISEVGARLQIPNVLPTVRGDRALLVSLWQNLIVNSLKFHGETPPEIRIAVRPADHGWEFALADNGIGIEPRFAEKIFVIFQRLHGRDRYPGTGIGLALCQKIVEFHGGQIWLDASYTGGARFCFTLPSVGEEEIRLDDGNRSTVHD